VPWHCNGGDACAFCCCVVATVSARFELAIPATERSLSVLPHAPLVNADKWLLKMHGCVTRVEDIVLTRSDYVRCVGPAGVEFALCTPEH